MSVEYVPVKTSDGLELTGHRHRPVGKSTAQIFVTHGLGEHLGRYGPFAEYFCERGISVCGVDLRGHGRSEGRQGDAGSYDRLLDDVQTGVDALLDPDLPVLFYGHSTGGQILVNFLMRGGAASCNGVVLSAPWLALRFQPPVFKVALARLALLIAPGFLQHTRLKPENLSRDIAHLESLDPEHLRHDLISARLYAFLTNGAERALASADEFDYPLLLIHGEADPLTSVDASRAFFDRAPSHDKTLRLYPDVLHEPHNDEGRGKILEETFQWMSKRLPVAGSFEGE